MGPTDGEVITNDTKTITEDRIVESFSIEVGDHVKVARGHSSFEAVIVQKSFERGGKTYDYGVNKLMTLKDGNPSTIVWGVKWWEITIQASEPRRLAQVVRISYLILALAASILIVGLAL